LKFYPESDQILMSQTQSCCFVLVSAFASFYCIEKIRKR